MEYSEEKLKALSIADLMALWESDFIKINYIQDGDMIMMTIQEEIMKRLDKIFIS